MFNDDEQQEEEELLLVNLEQEVEALAQKAANYRATLSHHLISTHSSLQQQQQQQQQQQPAAAGPTTAILGSAETETMPSAITGEPEELNKIQLLKEKIAGNASTALLVWERVKQVMVKIDEFETSNVDIHPAFKRKRTN